MRQLSQLEIDIFIHIKRHPGLITESVTADWSGSLDAIAAVQFLSFARLIDRDEAGGWMAKELMYGGITRRLDV